MEAESSADRPLHCEGLLKHLNVDTGNQDSVLKDALYSVVMEALRCASGVGADEGGTVGNLGNQ